MNKRFWGIIIIFFATVVIAGIVYVIFFYKPSAPVSPADGTPLTPAQNTAGTPLTQLEPAGQSAAETPAETVSPLSRSEIKAGDLVRLAQSFAERYGSFSNQSDYGNIRDLRIFMTDKMKVWADNYIADAKAKQADTTIYYGIVTKATSGQSMAFDADAGLAEVLVKTQRRESSGLSANSTTYYQDILIKYRREQGVWRIDGLYWQTR